MAELCTRKKCVAEIENIVMRANERIVLVSPYIKADDDRVERLKRKTEDVEVIVIYGKDKYQPRAKSLFEAKGVTKIFVKDLHSKCYLNEEKALVTSMNLYEYSQNNNEEMGILVTKKDDQKLYEDVIDLVEHWEEIGLKQSMMRGLWHSVKAAMEPEAELGSSSKTDGKKAKPKTQSKKVSAPTYGCCIRCGDDSDIYPSDLRPYCLDCYKKWKKAKQPDDNPEKHCHLCRKESKTCLARPACGSCFKKYKHVVKFKAA